MSKRRRIYAWSSTALAICALGWAAVAHAGSGPHRVPGKFAARYAEQLGLDTEVQAKIQEIVALSAAQDETLREELRHARHQIRAFLGENHRPDEASVMAKADAIGEFETEIHKNRLRALLEIRKLLSPTQRQELVRLREEQHGMSPHKKHGRHGHGIDACRNELHERCPNAQDGRTRLACLLDQWETISEQCRKALDPSESSEDLSPRDAP